MPEINLDRRTYGVTMTNGAIQEVTDDFWYSLLLADSPITHPLSAWLFVVKILMISRSGKNITGQPQEF